MKREIRIGLVGAGMFGSEVHLPVYAQVQRHGIVPWLGRLGLDHLAQDLADIRFRFVALATRTEASGRGQREKWRGAGLEFSLYSGETPWETLLEGQPELDVLAVALPDHLHTAPILAALSRGVHVITEKPMCLHGAEADRIVAASEAAGRIVAVDMHKRYDPDHLRLRDDLVARIGTPLYGRAVLEEPIRIPTQVFRSWAERSDPFTYVGCHWTDLYVAYFKVKPVSLHAVGQKQKLRRDFGMDAYDSVQVKVQFDNGMSIDFVNSWILPDGFEGPVNQESQLFGTDGVVESDTQYRGLRYAVQEGTRTANTHFTREIRRPDGSTVLVGYGADSLIVGLVKAAEVKFLGKTLDALEGTYPSAREARISTLIIHAAREVLRRNTVHMEAGRGAPVTAVFGREGITVFDPYGGNEKIYDRPV